MRTLRKHRWLSRTWPDGDLKMVRAVSAVLLFLLCVVIVSRLMPKRRRLQSAALHRDLRGVTMPNVESGVEDTCFVC